MKSKNILLAKKLCGALVLLGIIIASSTPVSFAGSISSDTLSVYVVNYPLKYFAERIGGQHVKVVFPAPRNPLSTVTGSFLFLFKMFIIMILYFFVQSFLIERT